MCQSNMSHCCTPGDFSIKNGLGTLLLQRDDYYFVKMLYFYMYMSNEMAELEL